MPYLHCPGCRLTVYNPPPVAAPASCPRCHLRLGNAVPSLFESDRPGGVSSMRMRQVLRERAEARGADLRDP
jgi:hypothetical protein